MDELILQIIHETQEGKKGVVPDSALFNQEIMPRLKQLAMDSLNALVKDGTVEYHKTLNGLSFSVKN